MCRKRKRNVIAGNAKINERHAESAQRGEFAKHGVTSRSFSDILLWASTARQARQHVLTHFITTHSSPKHAVYNPATESLPLGNQDIYWSQLREGKTLSISAVSGLVNVLCSLFFKK